MKAKLIVTLAMILASSAIAVESIENTQQDGRTLVEMPIEAQQFVRQKMVENLTAVSSILAAIDNEDWSSIETIASNTLAKRGGMQAKPKARPGQYMPMEMRKIGQSMHQAGDELIIAAQEKDKQKVRAVMQRIVNACVACHSSYRIR